MCRGNTRWASSMAYTPTALTKADLTKASAPSHIRGRNGGYVPYYGYCSRTLAPSLRGSRLIAARVIWILGGFRIIRRRRFRGGIRVFIHRGGLHDGVGLVLNH